MGRHPDPERRAELLDEVVRYLGRHGIAGVSLRPVASALGVSVNALVHHFGSKDELVVAALRGPLRFSEESKRGGGGRYRTCPRRSCSGAGGGGSTAARSTWRWCDSVSKPPC